MAVIFERSMHAGEGLLATICWRIKLVIGCLAYQVRKNHKIFAVFFFLILWGCKEKMKKIIYCFMRVGGGGLVQSTLYTITKQFFFN